MKTPAFRKKSPVSHGAIPSGDSGLPRWDLTHLYPSLDSEQLAQDRKRVDALIRDFKDEYEETVAKLTGDELGQAIARYEQIEELRHKIYSYTYLLEQENTANIPKTENLRKWMTEAGDTIEFFEGEINCMKESDLLPKLSAPALALYAPWIAAIRADSGYMLSDDVETMCRDINTASGEALKRLYDQTIAGVRIDHRDKRLTFDEANIIVSSPATPVEDRARLRGAMAAEMKKVSKRVSYIYNTMVQSQVIDAECRQYERPEHEVNTANRVDAATVDAMFDAIRASYSRLSNRYFSWKADQHGVEQMKREQLAAPLPNEPQNSEKKYPFEEGKRIVLRAFRKFSPRFSRIAQKFFDENYIDAEPRAGKDTGGFAMPTGPQNFPYILINYTGKTEDVVSSLGHELGHGVHQALAEKARGSFLSDMPTTIAETASIFAEMLVFEEILKGEKDPVLRRKLLSEKVENMLDNSLRQISYYDFERRVYEERKRGELDAERISDIWLETQKAYFGPALQLDECDRYRWMTIPHFFDTPFYVYSYSFAQVAVSGLFQAYKQAEKEGEEAREQFVADYIGLLETGITKNMYEMFKPFDLDPETPEFWEKGLSLMEKYINDLANPNAPAPKLQEKFNHPDDRAGVRSRKPRGPNL